MAASSSSIRWYQLTYSNLFKLNSIKFSWLLVMIVELVIIGLISYWICRDPSDLRQYEEAFLRRYVYLNKHIGQPIPSVFRNQGELVSKLCSQFVQPEKMPRMEIRLLGFKKAIHKPVRIEMVKCGKGVGLIQAPGHNSFYILHRGKYSKYHDARVFNIFRKAFYITYYEDKDEEYQGRTFARAPSFDDLLASRNHLAKLPHSYSTPRRYEAQLNTERWMGKPFSHTTITSDEARHPLLYHQSNGSVEDCLSPHLAARSPRPYHSLTEQERFGIHFSEPSRTERAIQVLKRLFSSRRTRRHRSERTHTSPLPLSGDRPVMYRSSSVPRNYPFTQSHSDELPAYEVRQPQLAYNQRYPPILQTPQPERRRVSISEPEDYHNTTHQPERRRVSISVPEDYHHATQNPRRPTSPPFRDPHKHYERRVRQTQMEELRRANAITQDQYVHHIPSSARDDVHQVMLPIPRTTDRPEIDPRAYQNVHRSPGPPYYPQYAARNVPNYSFVPEDNYGRRFKPYPIYPEYGLEKDRRYNDYLVGGASQADPNYRSPDLMRTRFSHQGTGTERSHDSPRTQSYPPDSRVPPVPIHDSALYPGYRTPIYQGASNPASSVPLAEPAKQTTSVSPTPQKHYSKRDKNCRTATGLDPSAETRVSSDMRKNSNSAENCSVNVRRSADCESGHAKLSAFNHLEVASLMAEAGSSKGGERFAVKNSRRERPIKRISSKLDDEDEPNAHGCSSKGRSFELEQVETISDHSSSPSEDKYQLNGRHLRSKPTRIRSGQRMVAEKRERRAHQFPITEITVDGESE